MSSNNLRNEIKKAVKTGIVETVEEKGREKGEEIGHKITGAAVASVVGAKAATAASAAAATAAVNSSVLGGTIFAPLAIAAKSSVVTVPAVVAFVATPFGAAVTVAVAGYAGAKAAGAIARKILE